MKLSDLSTVVCRELLMIINTDYTDNRVVEDIMWTLKDHYGDIAVVSKDNLISVFKTVNTKESEQTNEKDN